MQVPVFDGEPTCLLVADGDAFVAALAFDETRPGIAAFSSR